MSVDYLIYVAAQLVRQSYIINGFTINALGQKILIIAKWKKNYNNKKNKTAKTDNLNTLNK